MTTARCGSQSTMRAPIPISLSTKKRRLSNIFSKISTVPCVWVATTSRDAREVGGEGRPDAVVDLRDGAAVRRATIRSSWSPGTKSVVAAHLHADAQALEASGWSCAGARRRRP